MNRGILRWVTAILAGALIGGVAGAAVSSAWDKDPKTAFIEQAAGTPTPGQAAPGDRVGLKIVRGGNQMTLNVTLDAWTS